MPGKTEKHSGLRAMLRMLETVVSGLTRLAMALAVLFLASIFALIAYSVMMRYFAGQPQPWIDEAAGWLLVGAVMLAIPEVQRRGDHIGIDMLTRSVGERLRRALLMFGVAMVFACAALFTREGLEMVAFSKMINILSNQIPEMPLWIVQSLVPIGFGLMALVALTQFACLLAGVAPREMARHTREEI